VKPTENPSADRAVLPVPVKLAAVAVTASVAFALSVALAWSLRTWRQAAGPPRNAPANSPLPAPDDRAGALLKAGRLAYQIHCIRCHGAAGHGDGSDAERLTPPPRDFASPHWRFAPTAAAVRQAIVAGIPGTAMPGWGASLSQRELDGLVAYVLTMAPSGRQDDRRLAIAEPPVSSALIALLGQAGFTAEARPRAAPPLEVTDLAGGQASLDDFRGRTVLVLFWGTTCAPCLAELPAAMRFADRHRRQGLAMLCVCVDETDAAAIRAVAGPQLAGAPLYVDTTGRSRHGYDVQSLPIAVLIDRAGRLIARAGGGRDWADPALDALIEQCLAPSAAFESPRPPPAAEDGHAPRADRRPG
jgi:mono/diheme cytochrome c family protein/thiol-disulfide isomerase/thioredoxin